MLATKEHVSGHYTATKTSWATDYVWVPGAEEVERRLLGGVLHPWHEAYAEWTKEEQLHPEEQARMEMETL
jgi:hypothetical protein